MNTIPNVNSNLNDWLNYMHNIHVSAIDMGLERVLPVFEKLAIDYSQVYVFTVAGTNGKGSTTATIAAICQQAGYKTALYQSPHLLHFNERVKINGEMVDDNTLIKAFIAVENARVACNLTLSFFEMTTLASFWIFAQQKCDVWVLEIGLGGRLDVVNIIDPNIAVVTNVGIDHTEWLGDNREKIGWEKAGILRNGIPFIYGEASMPATVLPLVKEHNATLWHFGKDYFYQTNDNLENWQYSNHQVTFSLPLPNLSIHNTATAITAVLASQLNISFDNIVNAISKIRLAGRFDKREQFERTWLFDVAHNEHGIKFLLTQFLPYWHNYQKNHPNANLYLIFSMLSDKDVNQVLQHLQTLPLKKIFCAEIDFFRAMPKMQLQTALEKYFDNIEMAENLEVATQNAILQSQKNDLILVCGSFHTISEVLQSPVMQKNWQNDQNK